MKKLTFILFAIILTIAAQLGVTSCQYKNEEEMFCDTANVSYNNTIVPILQTNCYRCHGKATNTGSYGIILEDYNVLKTFASNGKLYGNAAHLPGYVPMPYDGGMLTDCELRKLKNWVDKGYPNN